MALVERRLNEVEWNKPGTKVQGHLIAIRRRKFKDGTGITYLVKGRDNVVALCKGATKLNNLLHASDMGKEVEIVYEGEDATRDVRPGMNAAKLFRVSVDEDSKLSKDELGELGITDEDIPF